jgi:hypothetical protein
MRDDDQRRAVQVSARLKPERVEAVERRARAASRWATGRARTPVALHQRVAISNRRLISANETGVTFKWKDYQNVGPGRNKTMTLPPHEFIRRFLIHVLPRGFHRIRRYGLLASGNRAANIVQARKLLAAPRSEVSLPTNASATHGQTSRIASDTIRPTSLRD